MIAVNAGAVLFSVAMILLAIPFTAQAAPSCTLTASPTTVTPGQGVTLTLTSSSGVTGATINNGVGSITPNGSRQSISIAQTTTYTATVTGSDGTAFCTTTVTVSSGESVLPGAFGPDGTGGGGGGGGGGTNPAQLLQGLGQTLQGLQGLLGGNNAQNAMCQPAGSPDCGGVCGMMMVKGKCKNVGRGVDAWGCSCQNVTNIFSTNGICQAGMCRGTSSGGGSGALGGGQGGLGLGALGQLLQGVGTLMGAGQGSGGSSSGYSSSYSSYSSCSQFYYTTTLSNDPCAIYQPGSSDLLNGTTSNPNLSGDLLDSLGNNATNTSTSTGSGNNNQVQTNLSATNTGQLKDGLQGDVRLSSNGATVIANLRQGLTEIAGFFGGNTFGAGGSQSALSRVCGSRPWAKNNFLGNLAPDGFFDGLCKRAGYQVGAVQQTGPGPRPNNTFSAGGTQLPATTTPTGPYIPPEADIRAEPAAVRLGARTYIFWNSKGVSSCNVTGPNFTQSTLSGAGATVPITGPTIFTIECAVANASSTVRDSVTVNLAI